MRSARFLLASVCVLGVAIPVRGEVIARHGECCVEKVKDQLVIHLKGSYREMGFAHGKMLKEKIHENAAAFLDHWCVGGGKEKLEKLREIYDAFAPHLPERYKEELAGLAAGADIPLDRVQLLHAIPERFHCSGAAAMKDATRDGKLYHTRSLDYALDIGDKKRVQDNAALVVYHPPDGHAYAVVGWAGFLGCVSGMNVKGISIGEMGSRSNDENYAGVPMIFLLREALRQGGTLEEALQVFRKGPRTCGYNFIVADGKIPDARAIEVTRSHILEFAPGDQRENLGPHTCVANCVRRVNHFVGKETAQTQREEYDPRKTEAKGAFESFIAYDLIGQWLRQNQGKIDAKAMIQLQRLYPPPIPCLHQVVFCPTDLDLWVSHAADPRKISPGGAQNRPFYRYNLKRLLDREPADNYLAIDYKDKPRDKEPPVEKGKVPFQPRGEQKELPELYRLAAHEFEYELQLKHDHESIGVEVYTLRFPSAVESKHAENNTVHCEYFRPKGKGPFPGVIVLDILAGDQTVPRTQASFMAQNGIAALFVQMAYYGSRRPPGGPRMLGPDIAHSTAAVRQTVLDLRRAAAWLESRAELDRKRLGIMGTSLGSFIGTLTAEMEPRLARVVILLGGGGLVDAFYEHPKAATIRTVYEALGGTKAKLREMIAPYDPITCAANLKDRRLLIIAAKRDDIVPPKCTEALWEATGKPRLIWYDCTHVGAVMYFVPAMQHILEHFAAP